MPSTHHTDPSPAPSLAIIGIGPGDPELITVKGLQALQQADVVFAPVAAQGKPSIAQSIIQRWLQPSQAIIPILSPMTRDAAALDAARQTAAETIARTLRPGRRGVYIILGDPMLYGTFTPIAQRLRALAPDIHQSIIPGVTAISAAAAATETPLASGSERLAILPGLRESSRREVQRLLRTFTRVAIMKAGPVFPMLADALDELDLLGKAVYVEKLGQEDETILRGKALARMPRQKRAYLSLMLVHNPRARASSSASRSPGPAATYPIHLINLAQKRILVVGGGPVGERKVRGLLAARARPILISPDATAQLRAWAEGGRLDWQTRAYDPMDAYAADLVFAATADKATNERIAADAAAAGAWCNVADDPHLGDFHVPAVHRGEGLVISVGTEGKAPARASAIRDQLARWLSRAELRAQRELNTEH